MNKSEYFKHISLLVLYFWKSLNYSNKTLISSDWGKKLGFSNFIRFLILNNMSSLVTYNYDFLEHTFKLAFSLKIVLNYFWISHFSSVCTLYFVLRRKGQICYEKIIYLWKNAQLKERFIYEKQQFSKIVQKKGFRDFDWKWLFPGSNLNCLFCKIYQKLNLTKL